MRKIWGLAVRLRGLDQAAGTGTLADMRFVVFLVAGLAFAGVGGSAPSMAETYPPQADDGAACSVLAAVATGLKQRDGHAAQWIAAPYVVPPARHGAPPRTLAFFGGYLRATFINQPSKMVPQSVAEEIATATEHMPLPLRGPDCEWSRSGQTRDPVSDPTPRPLTAEETEHGVLGLASPLFNARQDWAAVATTWSRHGETSVDLCMVRREGSTWRIAECRQTW